MAVLKRLWFPNAPIGSVNELQRSQIGIHYPFVVNNPTPPVPPTPVIPTTAFLTYFQRYLNDSVVASGIPTNPSSGSETDTTRYLRRYLNDPSS